MVLAICVAVAVAGCDLLSPGPGKAVTAFLKAVEDRKYDEAAKLLFGNTLRKMGPGVDAFLAKYHARIQSAGGIKTAEVVNEEIRGDVAKVTVKVTYGSGESSRDEVNLVKEGGGWKVDCQVTRSAEERPAKVGPKIRFSGGSSRPRRGASGCRRRWSPETPWPTEGVWRRSGLTG